MLACSFNIRTTINYKSCSLIKGSAAENKCYNVVLQTKTTEENERRLSSEMQEIREEMGECDSSKG